MNYLIIFWYPLGIGAPIEFLNCNERCAYMELCAKMWGLNCLEKIIYIH